MASVVELAPVPAMTGTRPATIFHHLTNHAAVLFFIQGGRLARGANGDDGIGTFLDVKVHQAPQGQVVKAAIRVHGGDEGNDTTAKHGHYSNRCGKLGILSGLFRRKQAADSHRWMRERRKGVLNSFDHRPRVLAMRTCLWVPVGPPQTSSLPD